MIFVGADHRGFKLKSELLKYLAENSDEKVIDCGAYDFNPDDDFNDPAVIVSKSIRENPGARGILICGTGHGMCMAANRFHGIRAANCISPDSAQKAREHNDANILCLGAKYIIISQAVEIVKLFLETPYIENENHTRRINRLDEREDYA